VVKILKSEDLIKKIKDVGIWKKGDQRAPHKPLLMLYALAQIFKGNKRFLPYEIVKQELGFLLKEFGPARKSYHPEHPFVRLKNDGIWELDQPIQNNEFSNKSLLDKHVSGGFTKEVYQKLTKNAELIQELTYIILDQHFPKTFHEDLLYYLELNFQVGGNFNKRRRDRAFREKILKAYEYSCAVCEFNVRLSEQLVGIEAAHIKWHHAGGPDNECNGVALCSLHHKLFDRGVFTISNSRRLIVSEFAHGNKGFDDWLLKYHNKEIKKPIHPSYEADPNFLNWHYKEVFRSPGRFIVM
jgi:putative restriction endonuclease